MESCDRQSEELKFAGGKLPGRAVRWGPTTGMTSPSPPTQQTLFPDLGPPEPRLDPDGIHALLAGFDQFGSKSVSIRTLAGGRAIDTYVNEFWTSKQRAANSLHEISYRACFKPQLPRFFFDALTEPGDLVYDPFLGRGTTMLEAALCGRQSVGCDVSPLSVPLTRPRMTPPTLPAIEERIAEIDFGGAVDTPDELLVFFHPDTLREICALQAYLASRRLEGAIDEVDQWIEMVAINRLTGHSKGFFSVYTLPPNQAVTLESQKKINARRDQRPDRRDVPDLILRKTRSLLSDVDDAVREQLAQFDAAAILVGDAADTPQIADDSVRLVVTSPPFLDVVQYKDDNWLRCWFCGIDAEAVPISVHRKVDEWRDKMTKVFHELMRVLQPGGYVAFEVGEVRGGKVRLDEVVVPCGRAAGLDPVLILINDQKFTKTANCWGVGNNQKGTNTNRVVLFRKAES